MKRSRPRQHIRHVKTRRGRKKILVNKGVKRRRKAQPYPYTKDQVKYVQGVINKKIDDNWNLSRMAEDTRRKLEDSKTIRDKKFYEEQLRDIKERVADNNEIQDKLERKYGIGAFRVKKEE